MKNKKLSSLVEIKLPGGTSRFYRAEIKKKSPYRGGKIINKFYVDKKKVKAKYPIYVGRCYVWGLLRKLKFQRAYWAWRLGSMPFGEMTKLFLERFAGVKSDFTIKME